MTFDEYQIQSRSTAIYLDRIQLEYPDMPPELLSLMGVMYCGLGLGEAGEIQGKIKKILRDDTLVTDEKRNAIASEISDLIWYCAQLCTELGLSLDAIAQQNLIKLADRQQRGVLSGSGDNR